MPTSRPRATRNEAQYRAAVERRRSNAATPVPSGKRYRRHTKHPANWA